MPTIREYLDNLRLHKERLAIWEAIVNHLKVEFLPRDERAARMLIALDPLANPSASPTVRQDTIEAVVSEIENVLAQHQAAIASAEAQALLEESNG